MELENLISIKQFCEHHAINETFILSLDDNDIIDIITINENSYIHLDSLEKTEKIIRLHLDLSINIEGICVILELLEKNIHLEKELSKAKNQLSVFGINRD